MADVIGKGVPAALCMSMIKYSLDSFPERVYDPRSILGSLNRVVERNIELHYVYYDDLWPVLPRNGQTFFPLPVMNRASTTMR